MENHQSSMVIMFPNKNTMAEADIWTPQDSEFIKENWDPHSIGYIHVSLTQISRK